MATVKFTEKNMPKSGALLQEALSEATTQISPLNDFIQVVKDLTLFEFKHQLNSQEFFNRFQNGEMGDSIEFIRWANKYEIYQEMKAEMDNLFNFLTQYSLPVSAT